MSGATTKESLRGLGLVGVPSDANSSYLRGAADAPRVVREVWSSGASNWASECGVDLARDGAMQDLGDLDVGDDQAGFLAIENHLDAVLAQGWLPLVLGGDHAITYPVMRAMARQHGPLDILHFDAHSDLYDEFEGNRYSHACPFARIMEEGLASRLVQVGIRTQTAHLDAQAKRFGVEVHAMRDFDARTFRPRFKNPVYITFDLDGLDPAFAPGVSHHEPGGMSTRDALAIIQGFVGTLVGADIVEYNPSRDTHGVTAAVVVKLMKELGGRLIRDNERGSDRGEVISP